MSRPDTKQKILEAAREVFAEHGFVKGSVEMVARKAGVSKTLVFWYFKNKDHLIEEVIKTIIPSKIVEPCMAKNLKGLDLIDCLVDSYAEFLSDEVNKKLTFHLLDLAMTNEKYRDTYEAFCEVDLKRIVERLLCKEANAKETVIARSVHGSILCNLASGADKELVKEVLKEMIRPLTKC